MAEHGDLSELYETMWPRLVGFFMRRGCDSYTAEDLASDSFLRVLKARPVELTHSYLWKAARWALGDFYRRLRPTTALTEDSAHYDPIGPATERIALDDALGKLTSLQRHAVLATHAGYRHREIGPTRAAASKLCHRGYALMRRSLAA